MSAFRVLIADGSPSVRAVLRRIVDGADHLTLAGEARDGVEAVALAVDLRPDAIVMDADMALGGGRTASDEILARHHAPVVLLATGLDRDRMVATFGTLSKGAVAVLKKPTVPLQWLELSDTLRQTLEHLGRNRDEPAGPADVVVRRHDGVIERVAIGSSTGGPRALVEVLRELDPGFRAAVAVVQHIASGFEGALVQWLAAETGLDVALASDGEAFAPGCVRLARPGSHLLVDPDDRLRLDASSPSRHGHRPSIDVLFESLAGRDTGTTAAILLSGMGADGSRGLAELKAAGAITIAQDEATSAIWGMPRIAVEIGAADLVLPPPAIGRLLRGSAGGSGR